MVKSSHVDVRRLAFPTQHSKREGSCKDLQNGIIINH